MRRSAMACKFLKSFSVLVILATLHGPSFSCPDYQRDALLQFKSLLPESLSSTGRGLDTWDSNNIADCCQWTGVECSDNTVTSLFRGLSFHTSPYAGMGAAPYPVSETISSDVLAPLFHVRTLTELCLANYPIEGEIPGIGLANLTQLVALDLSGNRFSGLIPWQLFNLSLLNILYLDNNMIEGNLENRLVEGSTVKIGIGNLTHLEELDLQDNKLSGPIPESISNLKNLTVLQLAKNYFSQKIPSSIGSLSNLKFLELNNNNLSGEIPFSIQKLDNLEIICLNENLLTGEIPSWLFDMNLYELNLGDNRLTLSNKTLAPKSQFSTISLRSCNLSGEIPFWLANMSLTSLDLSNNYLIGKIPQWLTNKSFDSLSLSNNMLLGSLPPRLFESPSLKILDLGRNDFSGPLPENIGHASLMRFLMLGGNKLTGSLPKSMSNMTLLVVLDLPSNRFSRFNLPFSPDLQIRYMDLHDNNITGELPAALFNMTSLEFLNIGNNFFQGPIPSDLSKLNSLMILDLSHNNFSGEIPPSLGNLSCMSSHCYSNFSEDPFYIGAAIYDGIGLELNQIPHMEVFWKKFKQGLPGQNLEMYTVLDLSVNQLSGHIPSTLGSLRDLKSMNLSHNQLSEHIPSSLGQLQGIESLDLSHNNLIGEIPSTFSNLLELSNLDLSNNKLEGPIPSGPQMDRLNDPSFYTNNNGLCGAQIQVACKGASVAGQQPQKSEEKETWFSWKMAGVGFPVGFLPTILIMYAIGFFTFPPQGRPHHYVRQNFSVLKRRIWWLNLLWNEAM